MMFGYAFRIYLILVCLLPTSVVLDVNVKSYATVFILIIVFISLNKKILIDKKTLIWVLVGISFILVYSIVSLFRGVEFDDYISHVIPVILFCFYIYLLNRIVLVCGDVYLINSLKSVLFCLAAIKLTFFLLDQFGIFPVVDYLLAVKLIFNYEIITLQTDYGARLHQSSDYLFLLYPLVIYYNKQGVLLKNNYYLNKISDLLLFFIITFAIVITYSRALWVFYLVNMLVLVYSYNKKIIIAIPIVFTGFLLVDGFSEFILARYSGEFAEASDYERFIMLDYMIESINQYPLFGLGLGGYMRDYVRFDDLKWNYELQLLSLMVSYGLVGFILLIILLSLFVLKNWTAVNKIGFLYMSTISSWIIVNIFNCFAFTSFGSIIFGVLLGLISRANVGIWKQKT